MMGTKEKEEKKMSVHPSVKKKKQKNKAESN